MAKSKQPKADSIEQRITKLENEIQFVHERQVEFLSLQLQILEFLETNYTDKNDEVVSIN